MPSSVKWWGKVSEKVCMCARIWQLGNRVGFYIRYAGFLSFRGEPLSEFEKFYAGYWVWIAGTVWGGTPPDYWWAMLL